MIAATPEELALELSRASLAAQKQSENQLRAKATAVLGPASIVVPVAALAIGDGPAGAAIPFGCAAVVYVCLVRECGAALVPRDVHGLINEGYRGELEVLLLNTDREEACELRAGDRIAQLVVVPCAPAEPVELELLSDSARGSGGFGSSGA